MQADSIKAVREFLTACSQLPPKKPNPSEMDQIQYSEVTAGHIDSVEEALGVLTAAFVAGDRVEMLNGICAVVWSAMAAGVSAELDLECAWLELLRSTRELAGPERKIQFDAEAKPIPPPGWTPPQMQALVPTTTGLLS